MIWFFLLSSVELMPCGVFASVCACSLMRSRLSFTSCLCRMVQPREICDFERAHACISNMMLKMDMELDIYQKRIVQNTPSRLPPVQSLNLSACMIQYLLLMSLAAVIPHRASLGKQLGLPDCKLSTYHHLHKASCCVG